MYTDTEQRWFTCVKPPPEYAGGCPPEYAGGGPTPTITTGAVGCCCCCRCCTGADGIAGPVGGAAE